MGTYIAISGERSIAGHEEMQLWGWNQWSRQSDQVVIHVRWIPQRGCAHWHDGRHQSVDLCEARILKWQRKNVWTVLVTERGNNNNDNYHYNEKLNIEVRIF